MFGRHITILKKAGNKLSIISDIKALQTLVTCIKEKCPRWKE